KWNEMDLNKLVLERTKDFTPYILHDGPPYANGDLHMGHALNKVLKDMINRHRSMTGYFAPYVPGWDTHGLPIEHALTKKGHDRKKMTTAEFRDLCMTYAYEQIDNQREQFRRIGVRGDWENPYITLKPEFEAHQIGVFGKMAEKGFIYKGLKPVYWSPSSESALAEAEIEYQDVTSPSIYVAFTVQDGKGILAEDESFIIWTTTPWTIPANLGISVNPEYKYVVVNVDGKKFVIAKGLVEAVAEKLSWENPVIDREISGSDLEHITAKHPLFDRTSLVMLGDHVTLDAGTGCVHTATGHGEDDYQIGNRYGLETLSIVDHKGMMTEDAGEFANMFYDKANKP
ncbi:MAG: class I tRNA ligase family protein, partial [Kurthia sp.]